jgi:hypothetical protein
MTVPAAVQSSQLVRIITLLYSMQGEDINLLADRLLQQRATEWANAISQELRRYGCSQTGRAPVGSDALELFRLSEQDAQGIASTYNRELSNQVQRLYAANPRGNRTYYTSNLEKWAAKREIYKAQQIALNTAATTRQFAQTRFRQMNNIERGKYLFSGPPPVCVKCVSLKAKGLVSLEFVNRHPSPQHPNCPHEWVQARIRGVNLDCATAWTGA